MKQEFIDKFDQIDAVDLYVNQHKSGREISDLAGIKNSGSIFEYLESKNVKRRRAARRQELRELPPVGTKFGLWEVISDKIKIGKNRNIHWLCKCKCGEIEWKSATILKAGKSTRCKKCGNKSYFTEDGEIDIEALILSKFNHIKNGISKRSKVNKLPFTIKPEDLSKLYNENHYCCLSGIDLSLDLTKSLRDQNLSVDRIDPNRGYEPDNIQLVDKRINMMKQSFSNDEFIELCCKVAERHGWSKCN